LGIEDRIIAHTLFLGLKESLDQHYAPMLAEQIAASLGVTSEIVLAVGRRQRAGHPDAIPMRGEILSEEFAAFRAAEHDAADEINFKTRAEWFDIRSDDAVERTLAELIDSVVLVDRLREVRASLGFRRYQPDADRVAAVVTDGSEASWLPAYEGFGEGIFLRFRASAMDEWAAQPEVLRRSELFAEKVKASRLAQRLHPFSPQYIALHSFAHALLRELAFSSGYSAASLRERVYCESSGDYGVFIYTTSSDDEGTLGGLVREGELNRLGSTLARAAEQLNWCSNDPVCCESHPQNLDGLNMAACHSCLLAAETSCDGFNLLLDRVMLVGSSGNELPGLLEPLSIAISAGN